MRKARGGSGGWDPPGSHVHHENALTSHDGNARPRAFRVGQGRPCTTNGHVQTVGKFVEQSQNTVCPYTMSGVEGAGNWWAILNQGRLNCGDACAVSARVEQATADQDSR